MKIYYKWLTNKDYEIFYHSGNNNYDLSKYLISTLPNGENKFDKIVILVLGDIYFTNTELFVEKEKVKLLFKVIAKYRNKVKTDLNEKLKLLHSFKEFNHTEFQTELFNGLLDGKRIQSFFKRVSLMQPKDSEHYYYIGNDITIIDGAFLGFVVTKEVKVNVMYNLNAFSKYAIKDDEANLKNITELCKDYSRSTDGREIPVSFDEILTANNEMNNIKYTASIAAETDYTILIEGDSGTGKELLAKAIHFNSKRKNEKYKTINCSAIPEKLIESTLFGHEKGSFSDAYKVQKGIFELAHKGTVFLDEIGDMSLSTQAKILRIIEEKKITRLGGEKEIDADTRIICATNKDLYEEVKENRFREDLYYRLNTFSLFLPPLKDRIEDIHIILLKICVENNFPYDKFDKSAYDFMCKYDYPGNIRQLISIIKRAIIYSKIYKKNIDLELIKLSIGKKALEDYYDKINNLNKEELHNQNTIYEFDRFNFHKDFSLKELLNKTEKAYILKALELGKTQNEAANLLGYSQQLISKRVKKYDLKKYVSE